VSLLNTLAADTQQCVLCIVKLHATVNNTKLLSVAQLSFHGEFICWQQ